MHNHQLSVRGGPSPYHSSPWSTCALGRKPNEVFTDLRDLHQRRRDLLVSGLRSVGFTVEVPPTGYFVIADAAPLGVEDALAWCRTLPEEAGVAGVPVQAFCSDPAQAPSLVRFGFCKTEDVIAEGLGRLQRWADARG